MDMESRFRKQKRPPIPELFADLCNEVEREYATGMVAAHGFGGHISSGTRDAVPARPYLSCVLEAGGTGELSTEPVDWDRLSEIGSEAGGDSKVDTICVNGAEIWCDLDAKSEVDSQLCSEKGAEDLDKNTINGQSYHSRSTRHHVSKTVAFGHIGSTGAQGIYEMDSAVLKAADQQATIEVDPPRSPSSPCSLRGDGAVSGWFSAAHDATARLVARCRAGISALPGMVGAAPQHDIGDFTSPREVWLAMQRALGRNVEERRAAQIFLCCTLCFLIVLTLSVTVLALLIVAFLPTEFLTEAKDHLNETGMLDSHGRPKSISRVLTVVMISLFAGNGLAISHPMRDALLCGI